MGAGIILIWMVYVPAAQQTSQSLERITRKERGGGRMRVGSHQCNGEAHKFGLGLSKRPRETIMNGIKVIRSDFKSLAAL